MPQVFVIGGNHSEGAQVARDSVGVDTLWFYRSQLYTNCNTLILIYYWYCPDS